MGSARRAMKGRGSEGGELLKGSNLPAKVNSITVFVHRVREAPDEWKSGFLADIDEVHGCTAFALNKTNVNYLIDECGDDFDKWGGYHWTLEKTSVTNPQTHAAAVGLAITKIVKSKRKPTKQDEVPF